MAEQCAWASLHVKQIGWINATVAVTAEVFIFISSLQKFEALSIENVWKKSTPFSEISFDKPEYAGWIGGNGPHGDAPARY
jgi:hypothetical protein